MMRNTAVGMLCALALGVVPGLAAEGSWTTLAPLPEARQEVGVAEAGGKVYLVGGFPTMNDVWEYDPAADAWRRRASLPIAVDHAGAASVGGKLYVVGGATTSGPTAAVYEYDPATDRWTQKASMTTGRSALAAVAIGGKIYAVGGAGGTERELEVFDPAANTWTPLPPMPTGRNHLAAGAIQGKLYVAGGRSGASSTLRALEVYDPAANAWETRAAMPTGRSGHAGAVVRDKLYTFGGEGNPASTIGIFKEVEVYDPAANAWTSLDPMPTPRHGIGSAVIGNRIYLPAGATVQGVGATGIHDAFVVQPEKLRFPQFASGGGISSEILLGNLSSSTALVTVELFDQTGQALEADLEGTLRSRTIVTIAPLGSAVIQGRDTGSATKVGSALVSSETAATGTILFNSTIPNFLGTAAVPASAALRRFFVPVRYDPAKGDLTGLALVNTTGRSVTVTLELRSRSGTVLATRELEIAAGGQSAQFLDQIFGSIAFVYSVPGSITVSSTGEVAAVALLFTGSEFATLPVSSY